MIEYWSVWNYSWWILSQLNIVNLNYSLATSIIGTSVMGGFIIHIYPRKLKVNYNQKRVLIPYKYAILLDIIGHQLPLYCLYKQRNQISKSCGRYLVIPVIGYGFINYFRNTPLDKTYGINSINLYLTGFSIISSLGNIYHCNKNTKL